MWFDEENGKYLSDPARGYADERYQRVLDELENREDGYYLVAELFTTGEEIGSAGIFPGSDGEYDIGYCVHKSKWRQGFGSEIVELLLAWLSENGAKRVTAEVAIDNIPSNRLLRGFGFEVERSSSFRKYNMQICFDSYVYVKHLDAKNDFADRK